MDMVACSLFAFFARLLRILRLDVSTISRRRWKHPMLDARMRRLIDAPLNALARHIASAGIAADQITIAGAALGVAGAVAIGGAAYLAGLALFLAGRVCDGLDGAVARINGRTDRGAFLDITLDFVVYAAIPLGFAVADPGRNAFAATALLAGFLANGTAFLGFAVMAERRGLKTSARGPKSIYYLAGLAEGTETIVVFIACCLWPAWFASIAIGFAVLCAISAIARIMLAWRLLSPPSV
jgi:phosphatidylglycerophosphate synthase